MMWWLHSLRWLLFSNSFTFSSLPYKFTRDGMNKFSQLNVLVSFTLWVTCLDPFSYMLPKVSIQSIGHASQVLQLA
jgi:hypothetical protein